ncbi:MAG: hypothetical protein ACOX2L_11530 [Anaerolineae bacterium]|jgi:RecA/RadA recombinase|nr:hypothetical protein [Chloroflexota bacterium]
MEAERVQRLASAVATIQARWGERALVSAREAPRESGLPSGIAALDAILQAPAPEGGRRRGGAAPAGGFPRGHLCELIGSGTAGHLLVAAHVLARAQRQRLHTVYIDVGDQVDVDALARCGVYLDALAILRATDLPQGLGMTSDLLRAGFGGVVVFDRVHDVATLGNAEHLAFLQQALRDWAPLLGRSSTTLLVLTEAALPGQYAEGLPLPFAADLRLLFERQRWLLRRRQVVGYVTRVRVIKSRSGAMGNQTDLELAIL